MPVPSPRSKLLPARGNAADLLANVSALVEGEICYAVDENAYYQKVSGSLVKVESGGGGGGYDDTALSARVTTAEGEIDTLESTVAGLGVAETALNGRVTALEGASPSLNDLSDVDTAGIPPDGHVLTYNFSTNSWLPAAPPTGGGGGGASSLDDLSDVYISSPSDGLVLAYDSTFPGGGGFTSQSARDLVGVYGEFNIDTGLVEAPPSDGQVLAYNDSAGQFLPTTISGGGGGGASSLNDLSDVDLDAITPQPGSILAFGGGGVFQAVPLPPGATLVSGSFQIDTGIAEAPPFDGQVLAYNDSAGQYLPTTISSGGGASSLNDLSDVDLDSVAPQGGFILAYNPVQQAFQATTMPLAALTDVDVTSTAPVNNDLLIYSDTTASFNAGQLELGMLGDTDFSGLAPDVLNLFGYSNTEQKWMPAPFPSMGQLSDVDLDTASPSQGDVLLYSPDGEFVPANLATMVAGAIAAQPQPVTGSFTIDTGIAEAPPTDGQVLAYNESAGYYLPTDASGGGGVATGAFPIETGVAEAPPTVNQALLFDPDQGAAGLFTAAQSVKIIGIDMDGSGTSPGLEDAGNVGDIYIDAYNWVLFIYTGPYDINEDAGGWFSISLDQAGFGGGGPPA